MHFTKTVEPVTRLHHKHDHVFWTSGPYTIRYYAEHLDRHGKPGYGAYVYPGGRYVNAQEPVYASFRAATHACVQHRKNPVTGAHAK